MIKKAALKWFAVASPDTTLQIVRLGIVAAILLAGLVFPDLALAGPAPGSVGTN